MRSIYEVVELFVSCEDLEIKLYDNNGNRNEFWKGVYDEMPDPYKDLEVDSIDQPTEQYALTINVGLRDSEVLVKTQDGYWVEFEEVESCMNEDLKKGLRASMGCDCSEQEFFDEYCKTHEIELGEEFDVCELDVMTW